MGTSLVIEQTVTAQITHMEEWRSAHRPAGGPVSTAAVAARLPEQQPEGVWSHAELTVDEAGPFVAWWGSDPEELQVMAMALLDAARAARNGDDINAVAQQEWRRRGGRPELD